jgi:hypothetical protein
MSGSAPGKWIASLDLTKRQVVLIRHACQAARLNRSAPEPAAWS